MARMTRASKSPNTLASPSAESLTVSCSRGARTFGRFGPPFLFMDPFVPSMGVYFSRRKPRCQRGLQEGHPSTEGHIMAHGSGHGHHPGHQGGGEHGERGEKREHDGHVDGGSVGE